MNVSAQHDIYQLGSTFYCFYFHNEHNLYFAATTVSHFMIYPPGGSVTSTTITTWMFHDLLASCPSSAREKTTTSVALPSPGGWTSAPGSGTRMLGSGLRQVALDSAWVAHLAWKWSLTRGTHSTGNITGSYGEQRASLSHDEERVSEDEITSEQLFCFLKLVRIIVRLNTSWLFLLCYCPASDQYKAGMTNRWHVCPT